MILAGSKDNRNSQNIVITPSIITVIDRSAHVITVQSVHGAFGGEGVRRKRKIRSWRTSSG